MYTKFVTIDGVEFDDKIHAMAHEANLMDTMLGESGLEHFLASIPDPCSIEASNARDYVLKILMWAHDNNKTIQVCNPSADYDTSLLACLDDLGSPDEPTKDWDTCPFSDTSGENLENYDWEPDDEPF